MKLAATLVVACVLVFGAAACGSGSSSGSNDSTTVAKKEAGLGVNLQVSNRAQSSLKVTICGDGSCRSVDLQPAQVTSMSASEVTGLINFQNGDRVDFSARNPFIGRPYVEVRSGADGIQTSTLSEFQSVQFSLGAHSFTASRDADTDYKMLKLTVNS